MDPGDDAVLGIAQRLIALIDATRHNSTYKFATLMSLIDICTEQDIESNAVLEIPITEIAHRFIAYYWIQTRDFSTAGILKQNQQHGKSIPHLVNELKKQLAIRGIKSPEAAREENVTEYLKLVYKLELTIAQQPLTHLQTPSDRGARADNQVDSIFDSSGFSKKIRRSQFEQIKILQLKPNIAFALRVLSPLLKPLITQRWSNVVIALNKSELETSDIAGFLFSPSRIVLAKAASPLREVQQNKCFYCGLALKQKVHVDHVIPWSRIPLDGIANLVLTHHQCNSDKTNMLPIWNHVERAINRPINDLRAVSKETRIPVLQTRTEGAARGIYSSLPKCTILWRGIKDHVYT